MIHPDIKQASEFILEAFAKKENLIINSIEYVPELHGYYINSDDRLTIITREMLKELVKDKNVINHQDKKKFDQALNTVIQDGTLPINRTLLTTIKWNSLLYFAFAILEDLIMGFWLAYREVE